MMMMTQRTRTHSPGTPTHPVGLTLAADQSKTSSSWSHTHPRPHQLPNTAAMPLITPNENIEISPPVHPRPHRPVGKKRPSPPAKAARPARPIQPVGQMGSVTCYGRSAGSETTTYFSTVPGRDADWKSTSSTATSGNDAWWKPTSSSTQRTALRKTPSWICQRYAHGAGLWCCRWEQG